ncbi:MAG: hypothetical protein EB141_04335, partial [Verrucomicrobia bacterium]|nr:hypothetical protein [Verrucomicrobiota bacterium]
INVLSKTFNFTHHCLLLVKGERTHGNDFFSKIHGEMPSDSVLISGGEYSLAIAQILAHVIGLPGFVIY